MRILSAAVLLLAAAAKAGENPGVTAAPILQVPVGARAVGMGTAFSAVASDISILHYNPAGLANLEDREASAMYLGGRVDQNVEHLALGGPLSFGGIAGSGFAAAGGSLLMSQNGRINVNTTNPDGSLANSQTLDAGGDLVATLGYAERVADTPVEGLDRTAHVHHFLGASAKFVRSTLAPSYAAQTFAGDLGYFVRSPELGVSAAASLLNLGGKMRFISQGDPLPLTMRAGTAYRWDVPGGPAQALTSALEWDYQYYERRWSLGAGLEYELLKHWAARLGYRFHQDIAGLTAGFGMRWGPWVLDYAWDMNQNLGDMHRFSFGFRFGHAALKDRERGRRNFIENVGEHEPLQGLEQERPKAPEPSEKQRKEAERSQGLPGWIY